MSNHDNRQAETAYREGFLAGEASVASRLAVVAALVPTNVFDYDDSPEDVWRLLRDLNEALGREATFELP